METLVIKDFKSFENNYTMQILQINTAQIVLCPRHSKHHNCQVLFREISAQLTLATNFWFISNYKIKYNTKKRLLDICL